MKKEITGVLLLISAILTAVLVVFKLNTYAIVLGTITVILIVHFIRKMIEKPDYEAIYNNTLRELIKTYDTILVDIEKFPNMDVKNIIKVSSFEKLVDIQYEIKKPIFYKLNLDSCAFILLDTDTAYTFILRVRENSYSPLDAVIARLEIDALKIKRDKQILDNIDSTTIIKIDNMKEYKVSPIRKKDASKTEEMVVTDKLPEELENKGENN